MTKRIMSILTTLVMVVGIVANVNLSSYAKTDYSKIIDVDIYKAQCFAGIAKDKHSDAVKRCNELYNYYINENIHSPTQSFLDAVYENKALMDDYNEWELYSLAAEPSSALDLVMKKSDYYESLIISMFSKASQSDSEWQKFLNNKIINGSNKMLNTLCSIANVGQVSELVDNLNIKDSKTVEYVKQTVDNYFPTGVASKVTGVVGDVLETAKDITDLVDKLSAYGSMVELDSSAKLWLEQMYNSCTSSTDTALKNALLNLKSSSTGFAKTALVMIKETSFSISNWAIKTAIDDGITALASTNPVVMAVCTGLKAGKTICNIFFNSDDVCEQLFLMECIYDVQDLSRNVAESCKNTFIKSQTKDNALTFTYAVDCYYESIINVDIDCMEDFLDKLYNGGILKELIKWIYGATDDYQDCVNTLEGLRNARIDNKTLMISYYKAALRANYPETFVYYYVKDDTVAITGLSFSVSRIFPPGYPAGYADLLVGDFSNLDIQYTPSNTTQKGFSVVSDNPDVIKVNGNVITAVSAGTAKITITSTENPRYFYTKEIKVGEKLNNTDDSTNDENITSRFTYIIKNDEVTITGVVDSYNLTSITIPSKIEGYPVTRIGDYAFSSSHLLTLACTSLVSVSIPNSITIIGDYAFAYCSSLKSIAIPNSVKSIGPFAFAGCASLTNVTIDNKMTNIGFYAFYNCSGLTIKCHKDSYAEQYAMDNGIKYELLDANPTVNPSEKPSQNSSNNPSQKPTNNSNNNPTNSLQNSNNNQSNKPNNNTNKQNPTTAPTTKSSNKNIKSKSTQNNIKFIAPTTIKKAKIKNLNAEAKGKKITVSWKKIKNAKGYQVQAATNKKFKKKQIVFDKKTKKKKITIKGNKIKKNRIYYIRVRAYTTGKNANGKPKYTYSKWTKKKVMTR